MDEDGRPIAAGQPHWSCGEALSLTPRLALAAHQVVLTHDTVLHGCHLAGRYDFSSPPADITRHPADPGLRGLRTLTAGPWAAREPSGRESQVASGRTCTPARANSDRTESGLSP
jgi:hypothetical protein